MTINVADLYARVCGLEKSMESQVGGFQVVHARLEELDVSVADLKDGFVAMQKTKADGSELAAVAVDNSDFQKKAAELLEVMVERITRLEDAQGTLDPGVNQRLNQLEKSMNFQRGHNVGTTKRIDKLEPMFSEWVREQQGKARHV